MIIVNPALDIGEEELKRRVEALEQMKRSAAGGEADMLLLAKLERLYCELLGEEREQAAALFRQMTDAIQGGSTIALKKCREATEKAVALLELGALVDLRLRSTAEGGMNAVEVDVMNLKYLS